MKNASYTITIQGPVKLVVHWEFGKSVLVSDTHKEQYPTIILTCFHTAPFASYPDVVIELSIYKISRPTHHPQLES
ncbi:unnamed protein product [Allacma fusca]|uniref:Uncharacterized protein n=1 Tax=Allacma fusca TaxID=39272 RepID=A0A8J2NS25_9HEXA|nr:unnamed protein product [Allacma fusca]